MKRWSWPVLVLALSCLGALAGFLVTCYVLFLRGDPLPVVDVLSLIKRVPTRTDLEEVNQGIGPRMRALIALANGEDCAHVFPVTERYLGRIEREEAGPWLVPPRPRDLRLAGRKVDMADYRKAESQCDSQTLEALDFALESARVQRPGGGEIIVFRNSTLGCSSDLWMVPVNVSGIAGPSYFLGDLDCTPRYLGSGTHRLSAHLDGGIMEIRWLETELHPRDSDRHPDKTSCRFSIDQVAEDSDSDGLTDLVEKRIRTDPLRQDTDRDGLIDSVDRTPNAVLGQPRNEEQQIVFDIFEAYFAFEERDRRSEDLAVMLSPFALEWRGRHGPTITLDEKECRRLAEEGDCIGDYRISIKPWVARLPNETPFVAPCSDDERVCSLDLRWYARDVLVKRCGKRWVIKAIGGGWSY